MTLIYVPTNGLQDWKRLLADPERHWQRAASAMELAISWELAKRSANGFPPEVTIAFDQNPQFKGIKLLLALPEHKVPLEGGNRPSQNDIWGLLRTETALVSMTVEGKALEPFGPTIGAWYVNPSPGRQQRLLQICNLLETACPPPPELRYQLFHRTASAILEAERYQAPIAVMMVQSFRENPLSWADFVAFCQLLGTTADRGRFVEAPRSSSIRLFLGWVDSELATDAQIAALV